MSFSRLDFCTTAFKTSLSCLYFYIIRVRTFRICTKTQQASGIMAVYFTEFDWLALGWFLFLWLVYAFLIERTRYGKRSISLIMENYRYIWFRTLLRREQRMIDTGVLAALQNGTAFFASTSLFAIGGTVSLLKSSDEAVKIMSDLHLLQHTSAFVWQVKVAGLVIIFVYAFFKFAWAYRIFNYSAIIIGACPVKDEAFTDEAKIIADRGAKLNIVASRHFNRGLRAFFFALGYLGWFVHPAVFLVSSTLVGFVLYHRQFSSDALDAVT